MDIDLTKLNAGLEDLTGKDLEKLEKIARSLGETMPEITLSKKYQALVAAKALGVKYDDITDLPAKKYLLATMTVFNFFYEDMAPVQTEDQLQAEPKSTEE
jgi:hypothetical protein